MSLFDWDGLLGAKNPGGRMNCGRVTYIALNTRGAKRLNERLARREAKKNAKHTNKTGLKSASTDQALTPETERSAKEAKSL